MVVVLAPANVIQGGGNGNGQLKEKPTLTIKGIDTSRILPLLDHIDGQKHIASFEKKSYEIVEMALETLKQKIIDKKGIDAVLAEMRERGERI